MKAFQCPKIGASLPTSTYKPIRTPSLISRRCTTSSGSTIVPLGFDKMSDVVVGIDLGTTNSCVALMEDNKPRVLENVEGMRTTPSVVAFLEDGQVLVGHTAKRQAQVNSEATVYAAKRLMGRSWKDPEIQKEAKNLPFKIVPGANGSDAWIQARAKMYSPAQIAAYVLEKMKQAAEVHLRMKVGRAVVTVPAYFNDGQRQATRDAGRIAGLRVERIINEPTAAALAYGFKEEKSAKTKTIAVYDLGGGTFDISVLEIGQGVIEVKATNGDTYLGGEDFDQVILKHLLAEAKKKSGVDIANNTMAVSRLREAAEKAKCELSSVRTTEINLPFLGMTSENQPFHFSSDLSRVQLENMVNHLILKTKEPCQKCIKDAGVGNLDEVILVGGMTRMPKVQAVVEQVFGKSANKSVNPDEAVAIGAAIQAGVLQGHVSGLVLVDIIPLSLGVELHGGKMSVFVPRNTKTPFRASQTFTTVENYQQDVSFKVYQGERARAADNKLLAQFSLKVPPMPKGVVSMECTFNIGLDGILKVSAKDTASGREANLEIRANTGLSEAQIDKMVKEADENREMDQKRALISNTINEIEAAIQAAEVNLAEFAHQLSPSDRENLKKAVVKAREYLAQQSVSKATSLPGSAYALVKDTIAMEIAELQKVLTSLTKGW